MMALDWERIAKGTGRFLLLLLEYAIKGTAVFVTGIVLVFEGPFGQKLAAGFSSISPALRKVFEFPSKLNEAAGVIYNYNALSPDAFQVQYGEAALPEALGFLNGGLLYLEQVKQSFANQPFSTFFAALFSFCILYLIGFVIRFYRHKGRGSWINRIEQKLGDRVFGNVLEKGRAHTSVPATPGAGDPKSKPNAKQEPATKKPGSGNLLNRRGKSNPFSKSVGSNKHLEQYAKSFENSKFAGLID